MTISIGSRMIRGLGELSDSCRLVLSMLDGGAQWFAASLESPNRRHNFPDETALLDAVQRGLHDSPLLLLRKLGLLISPIKLMTLGFVDLRLLARAEAGDDSAVIAHHVQKMLSEHSLVTLAEIKSVDAWLGELGVADAAVFQAMGFSERLALHRFTTEALSPHIALALRQEAASFAVEQGCTPFEFCDYYRLYLNCAITLPTFEERIGTANRVAQALFPLLLDQLDTPEVQGVPAPDEVASEVRAWLACGRQVGFARLSLGAQQVVGYAQNARWKDHDVREDVRVYMRAAQMFLASHSPRRAVLGQDGSSCAYHIQESGLHAVLHVSHGLISLASFGAVAATGDSSGS
jgi:hypothetical protein